MARPCAYLERLTVAALAVVAICLIAAPRLASADEVPDAMDFATQVAPLLVRNCLGCHAGSEPAGDLNLTTRAGLLAAGKDGAIVVPGKPDDSRLVRRIRDGEMPPPESGMHVTPAEVDSLARWIAAGATWPEGRVLSPYEFSTAKRAGLDWWSLRPPVRPELPAQAGNATATNEIDAFVAARLAPAGLSLAPQADRRTLLRRATFDLLGLPPTPEEIATFLADDTPDAYERLIDRLLASPHYGERWGRHWLDVARFGETDGYETNHPRPNAWPYRDYVIRALNADKPYPQFILDQLAGDTTGEEAATGFLVGGTHDVVPIRNIEGQLQQRADDLDDIVSTTIATFLGLSVGCARCHDHKSDPISQTDYFAVQAVFAGVLHGERELRSADYAERVRNEMRVRRELTAIDEQLAEVDLDFEKLAEKHDPPAAADDSAAGSTQPVVEIRSLLARRGQLFRQLPAAGITKIYAGRFEQPRPTRRLQSGDPQQPREVVAPGGLSAIGPTLVLATTTLEQRRRVALAKWIADPASPLVARVLVNRLWHYHFGQGLVATPNNFGFHGGRSSHPELLDWLASEFVEHDWSIKAMHRLIMFSATYRQASASSPQGLAADAHNRLLWRYRPRRLEAEPIHDAMLAASGLLDLRLGGPSYDAFEPSEGYLHQYIPKESYSPSECRRMVYGLKPRIQQDATFDQFDCPDASQSAPRRNVSTTPMQALNLLNSPIVCEQSQAFAERLQREAGVTAAAQVALAFRLALARAPDDEELAQGVALAEEHGLAAFCRGLFNTSEFIYVD